MPHERAKSVGGVNEYSSSSKHHGMLSKTKNLSASNIKNNNDSVFSINKSLYSPFEKGMNNLAYTSTPLSSGNLNLEINDISTPIRKPISPTYHRSISSSSTSRGVYGYYETFVKDVKTQTEAKINVISSWKLVETRPVNIANEVPSEEISDSNVEIQPSMNYTYSNDVIQTNRDNDILQSNINNSTTNKLPTNETRTINQMKRLKSHKDFENLKQRNHSHAANTTNLPEIVEPNNIQRHRLQSPDSSTTNVTQSTQVTQTKRDSLFKLRLPPGHDYVVVNTKSLGVDGSSQTKNACLYRYDDRQVLAMVNAWKVLTILLPGVWLLLLYTLNQLIDILVIVEVMNVEYFTSDRVEVMIFFFLHMPITSIVTYTQLTDPNELSITKMNKTVSLVLAITQVAPYFILVRRIYWCFQAMKLSEEEYKREKRYQHTSYVLNRSVIIDADGHELTKSDQLWKRVQKDSIIYVVVFQSILESVPEFAIQTSIIMRFIKDNQSVSPILWAAVFINVTSGCYNSTSIFSSSAADRLSGFVIILFTLGSRVLVCSGASIIQPVLFIAPFLAAFLIAILAKFSEFDDTFRNYYKTVSKSIGEGFLMATVCPPFNTIGIFSAITYVLSAICVLMENPGHFLNIFIFLSSVVGQVAWLGIGFVIKEI